MVFILTVQSSHADVTPVSGVLHYIGLSTDTKPTATDQGIGIPAGSTFYETNTTATYTFNSSSWDIGSINSSQTDVSIQDQNTPPIDTFFLDALSNFTLSADTGVSGAEVVSLVNSFTATAGHGITPGAQILLLDIGGTERSFYAEVLTVVTNTITLDRFIDHDFPATLTLGRIVTNNMAVDGSVTPRIFSLRAGETPIDFTRFIIHITGTTAMDEGTFGDESALAKGMVFRIVNGFQKTIWNIKTNGDFSVRCYDTDYPEKAPAGTTAFKSRCTFAGQDKHGVVLRISTDDVIQFIVQDDQTGNTAIRVFAEGHLTEGEEN